MTHIKGVGSVSKLPVGSLFLVPDRPYQVIETVIGLGPVRMPSGSENLEIWSSKQALFPLLRQASWKPGGRKDVLFPIPQRGLHGQTRPGATSGAAL